MLLSKFNANARVQKYRIHYLGRYSIQYYMLNDVGYRLNCRNRIKGLLNATAIVYAKQMIIFRKRCAFNESSVSSGQDISRSDLPRVIK